MKVKIPAYKSYLYREIFLIVDRYSTGEVRSTCSVGFMGERDANELDPKEYVSTSISTSLTRNGGDIELKLFDID